MKSLIALTVLFAAAAPSFGQGADARAALAIASVAELNSRVAAVEQRLAALESRQPPRAPAAPDGLFGQLPAARPAGDGWTLDHARGVWWRPMPAGDAGAFAAVPYYGAAFGDGGSACGPGGCGPAAGGGYRFAPFGGRFRR